MESRKLQLQKQILEALEAEDNDLYILLKSQWAHRFGVESLEELKHLDLDQINQKYPNLINQKLDQSEKKSFESDKAIPLKDDVVQEKAFTTKEFSSSMDENNQSLEIKSYEIVDKENNKYKDKKPFVDNNSQAYVEALIPIPPKPKYSYLKKWLLRR